MKCPKCGQYTDPFATKCPNCGPMGEVRRTSVKTATLPPPPEVEAFPLPDTTPEPAEAAAVQAEKPKKGFSLGKPKAEKPQKAPKPVKEKPVKAPKPQAAKPAKAAAKPGGNNLGFLSGLLEKFSAKPKAKAQAKAQTDTSDIPDPDELSVDEPITMVGLQATCMRCNKPLWASNGTATNDEMVQHAMSRAMFCVMCQHTYCKECAHEAGKRKGTNEYLCPKCGKPLTQ